MSVMPTVVQGTFLAQGSIEMCTRRSNADISAGLPPDPTGQTLANFTAGTETVTCARKLVVAMTVASGDVGTTMVQVQVRTTFVLEQPWSAAYKRM